MADHLINNESIHIAGVYADISSLKSLNTSGLPHHTWAYVEQSGTGEYYFDLTSSEFESLPDIIAPVTGIGRWIKKNGTSTNNYNLLKKIAQAGFNPNFPGLTASTVPYINSSNQIVSSAVNPTELSYLSGVVAPIQTQIDSLTTGLFWKAAVRVATTTAGTLSTDFENGDIIDGVTLATGDRVLIKDQTTASENGIYVVNASGAPTRTADFDSGADNLAGATMTVQEGTLNADTKWTCSSNNPITIGTTDITFVSIGGTLEVSDIVYGPSWDGVTAIAPSKNAVYDKIESLASDFVNVSGDTMTGNLNLGSNNITDVGSVEIENNGSIVSEGNNIYVTFGAFDVSITTYDGSILLSADSQVKFGKGTAYLGHSVSALTTNRTVTWRDQNGTVAYTNDKLSAFASTTSAELAGVISDETGSGSLVFATSPTLSGLTLSDTTASTVPYLDASKILVSSSVTPTELGYVSGVTSNIQSQIDQLTTGLFWKAAVRVATIGAGTLSTDFENGNTIDGVTLATGDRILIKDQATASENGIYVVNASGAPTRTADFDSGADNLAGATMTVQEGTLNADTKWTCSSNNPITIGTTDITFVSIGGTLEVSDITYGSSWNGVTAIAPSKNAVYDKIESLASDFVNVSGDTMTGDLNMGGNDVTNVTNIAINNNGSIYSGGNVLLSFTTSQLALTSDNGVFAKSWLTANDDAFSIGFNNEAFIGIINAEIDIESPSIYLKGTVSIRNFADESKVQTHNISGYTPSTTRTITWPDKSGTPAFTNDKLSAFAATTSTELAGVISDETGTGSLVFATSPTLVTPILGAASATSLNVVATTASTSTTTGALTVAGGLGVAGALYPGSIPDKFILRHADYFTTQRTSVQGPAFTYTNGDSSFTYTSVSAISGYMAYNSGTQISKEVGYILDRSFLNGMIKSSVRLNTGAFCNIFFRTGSAGYALTINIGTSNNIVLSSNAGGTLSTVSTTVTAGVDYAWTVKYIGSSIVVLKDGVQIISITNTGYTIGTFQLQFGADATINRTARLNYLELYDSIS